MPLSTNFTRRQARVMDSKGSIALACIWSLYRRKALMTVSISSSSLVLERYSWMFRNSDEWMLGCQVRNQSVEKGSWPFEGLLPATSLYRRNRRSYDRLVSYSSTCRRAPSWIREMARSMSRDSLRMLFCVAMSNSRGGEREVSYPVVPRNRLCRASGAAPLRG